MKKNHQLFGTLLALLFAVFVAGCAISPYLNLTYKHSEPSYILAGQRVFIDLKDVRSDQAFLGKKAESHLKHFIGKFHLFIDHDGRNNEFTGTYDLKRLFKKLLIFRLRNQGVQVAKTKSENSMVMEIELKKFTLDLKDNNWITSIDYAARMVHGKGSYVAENISVTAERYKIWRRKEAEKILSEAITDAVNKLDVQRLFEKRVR